MNWNQNVYLFLILTGNEDTHTQKKTCCCQISLDDVHN